MKIENINIEETLKNATKLIAEDKGLSPAIKSLFEVLVLIITLLANRLNLNSKNSSKPPSTDPNREKTRKKNNGNKAGGQKGHVGKTLEKVNSPDKVEVINVDRSKLPPGEYTEVGHETRQVFDIEISRIVTEYQAQVLQNGKGEKFTAPFPKGITKAVQYGESIKAHSVYMSQFQLIPYDRVRDYFANQLGIVDLIPNEQNGTLKVRLHQLANRSTAKIIGHLCKELNATCTKFPGTKLQLIYELVS